MTKLNASLLLTGAAGSVLIASQAFAAEAPSPLGLYEDLAGTASLAFAVAVKDDPLTTKNEAKPAELAVTASGYVIDEVAGEISAYSVVNSGPTSIVAAVKDNPDTVADEAKPALASTAITETDGVVNSAGATFSRYTGTSSCELNALDTECDANLKTDVTALASRTAVTADGVTVTNGTKTVSLTSGGLNNGGNVLSGVGAGVADTDAVNFKQLKDERAAREAAVSSLRTDLTTETNARIATDNELRDRIASSTATAIALGGATILPDVNFSLSGNVGFYQGATAMALNAAARVAPNMYVTGAVGGGLNKHGEIGGRVGFAIGF